LQPWIFHRAMVGEVDAGLVTSTQCVADEFPRCRSRASVQLRQTQPARTSCPRKSQYTRARRLLEVFCQHAFCRRSYNLSPTISWVQSAAEFQKRLRTRIREIRTTRGFSQESLPKPCDLHRTHVSLLECSRINVTVNTTRQIAHVLQISLSELFRGLN
jgi:DNA-binding XRE family transcriptional regulator